MAATADLVAWPGDARFSAVTRPFCGIDAGASRRYPRLVEVFLVRHAIAAARGDTALDSARPLTPEGRRRFARMVRGLERLEVAFDAVYHSPWTRAVQTAGLLEPITRGTSEPCDALVGPPDGAILERLRTADVGSVALVGHEPWLGQLGAWLAFDHAALGARFELKKGAVLHLAGDPHPGAMRLIAMWPPRALRRCAGKLN